MIPPHLLLLQQPPRRSHSAQPQPLIYRPGYAPGEPCGADVVVGLWLPEDGVQRGIHHPRKTRAGFVWPSLRLRNYVTDPASNDTDGDWLSDIYEATNYNGTKSTIDYNPFAQEVESPSVTKCALQGYKNGKWVTKSYGGIPYTIWEGDLWVWVSAAITDNSGLKSITIKIKSPVEDRQTYYFPEYQTSAVGFVNFDLSFRQSIVGANWEWDVDISATDHLGNSGEGANIYREGWLKTVAEASGLIWLYDRAKEAKEVLEDLLNWLHDWAIGRYREMLFSGATGLYSLGNKNQYHNLGTSDSIIEARAKFINGDVIELFINPTLFSTVLFYSFLLITMMPEYFINALTIMAAAIFIAPFCVSRITTFSETGDVYSDVSINIAVSTTGKSTEETKDDTDFIFGMFGIRNIGMGIALIGLWILTSFPPEYKAGAIQIIIFGLIITVMGIIIGI